MADGGEIEWYGTSDRLEELTEQDQAKLKAQESRGLVSEFKQTKLEQEAAKNWDRFYKRNETKFYKDRHWTTREFGDLLQWSEEGSCERRTLLEVGCGVGNFLFPLLEEGHDWFIHACDFSPRAIEFVKTHPLYDAARVHAFVHDITSGALPVSVPPASVHVASMIFVLSAICPRRQEAALRCVRAALRPGGALLFRDYGRHDVAQLRFGPGHKLADNFYVRQDGTRAFYFSVEQLSELFARAGFTVDSCSYVSRRTLNRKQGVDVRRTFVQGRFVKTADATS